MTELLSRLALVERRLAKLESQLGRDRRAEKDSQTPCRRIVRLVAGIFGLSEAALLGRGRPADVVWARWVAMWCCRSLVGVSSTTLGRLFRRDHSSVCYGLGSVDEAIELSPRKRQELDRVFDHVRRELDLEAV